jgi:ribosomal protein S18 acetylase RimI-like enzyme
MGTMDDADVRLVFTADDTTAAAEMLHAFNREFDTPTPGPDAIAIRLAELLGEDTTFALVVSHPASDELVGVALVSLRTNVWYQGWVGLLDELYVAPEHRNHGLGTALLRAAEADVVNRGGDVLEIGVDGEDVDAQRFYERHGYIDHDEWAELPSKMYFRELRS